MPISGNKQNHKTHHTFLGLENFLLNPIWGPNGLERKLGWTNKNTIGSTGRNNEPFEKALYFTCWWATLLCTHVWFRAQPITCNTHTCTYAHTRTHARARAHTHHRLQESQMCCSVIQSTSQQVDPHMCEADSGWLTAFHWKKPNNPHTIFILVYAPGIKISENTSGGRVCIVWINSHNGILPLVRGQRCMYGAVCHF